jgi:hypothetical protein
MRVHALDNSISVPLRFTDASDSLCTIELCEIKSLEKKGVADDLYHKL